MVTTAAISMWISNTATAMLMLPIALALVKEIGSSQEDASKYRSFSMALLFGVGYAASIGGIGTLIGTPPNIIFATQVNRLFPEAPEITFFDWLKVGLPLVMLFLPLAWWYLVKVAFPQKIRNLPGGKRVIRKKIRDLGPMSRGEILTFIVFLLTAMGWVFRKDIDVGLFTLKGWSGLLGVEGHVHDSTVAIGAAILLFVLPVNLREGSFVLDWKHARKIPWGILLLFGGGLALASQFQASGLTSWIASHLHALKAVPVLPALVIVVLLIDFLTEITSNTAVTTIFLPVLAATAVGMGTHPYLFMVAGTIAASLAFMLPVATPPNAVIFSSGLITIPRMARTGFIMNILGMIVTTAIVYLVAVPVFRITLSRVPQWVH